MAAQETETGSGGARSEKPAPERREVDVVDAGNKKVGSLDLEPRIFGVPVNDHLIYEAVKQYRASGRAGTHKTKTRGLVSGTGRKPWRQKGTGRARVGESRIPLWRHGGTVFGPQPRDYSYSMPKKARAAALRSALSQRTADGGLRVVDALPEIQPAAEGGKPGLTRQLTAFLKGLELTGQKTLIVESEPSDALILSSRNIPGVRVLDPSAVTVYDVLDCRTVLLSRQAVGRLEERLLR
jgi:large subunit ribosomal protein L4